MEGSWGTAAEMHVSSADATASLNESRRATVARRRLLTLPFTVRGKGCIYSVDKAPRKARNSLHSAAHMHGDPMPKCLSAAPTRPLEQILAVSWRGDASEFIQAVNDFRRAAVPDGFPMWAAL